MITKFAWMLWALVPVAGLAYHFGPGQRPYNEDRAADLLADAAALSRSAEVLQNEAHERHLASLAARKAALASDLPADAQRASAAASAEDQAYAAAAKAWNAVSDKLREAHDLLAAIGSEKAIPVRIARARALIRAGRIVEGVGDLEALLDTLDERGGADAALAAAAREELATGYYYGARLMRIAGKPTAEWREVSGWARQNFRYLAESGDAGADAGRQARARDLQMNLELVLNLEQSAQEDLLAAPLPKNSPRNGNCEGLCNCKGKGKRPPQGKQDARGAGGVGDVPGGW